MATSTTVKGYAVFDYAAGTETLFAVDAHRIFAAGPHKIGTEFDNGHREWKRVYELPATAEFIGNYPLRSKIVKFA